MNEMENFQVGDLVSHKNSPSLGIVVRLNYYDDCLVYWIKFNRGGFFTCPKAYEGKILCHEQKLLRIMSKGRK